MRRITDLILRTVAALDNEKIQLAQEMLKNIDQEVKTAQEYIVGIESARIQQAMSAVQDLKTSYKESFT